MKKLYFIAVYPPENIMEEVKVFKKDLADSYGNSKALKNDAHITLFPPFSREIDWEEDIFTAFQKIDTGLDPFEIELNGFGSFAQPKNPVIFIQPEANPNLTDLYQRVKQQFNFISYSFTPHMTVGYRDLTWENFLKAWDKYQNIQYKTKFLVDKILLLRHDGKWVPIAEKKLTNTSK
ncbi:RNA 2',3'-cyclic phosphodiesterase [Chryseobacterium lactis]|uniref:2'-5' RNA ligase family protein n=1 Tax=Chryseobacterium lactis TaxID=1241981 RepID=A0A3G6RVP6_CHRLC|nr:2'-5' RNA ligase family protein [Chryseobacterium lactis]AZA80963.1 2'-5' RNA ligase family protein [Chryseobacterium lactis]AZB05964.1 2'-5' RNA ligase family protein [Chryseobacterium lactis]PNW13316.1 RNA 2',3'-cyclic phosphodiesterase [Chryseobacterium lactis]